MISVGHRSLSGRAIRLISGATEFEFESEIDLFIKKKNFSKSQNNAHVTFGSISTARPLRERDQPCPARQTPPTTLKMAALSHVSKTTTPRQAAHGTKEVTKISIILLNHML